MTCHSTKKSITVDELEQKRTIFLRRIENLASKQTNCKDGHHLSVLIQFIIHKEFVCILELVAVMCDFSNDTDFSNRLLPK